MNLQLFLSYYINSNIGRKIFESLAQGATRYTLSKSNFNKVKIQSLTLKEQTAIATILSDIGCRNRGIRKATCQIPKPKTSHDARTAYKKNKING